MKKYSILFFLTMFIIGTDTFLISPLLPTLTRLYGIDSSVSGWMVSAYAIGYAFFALVSGPISDGRDRKKVMSYGLAAFAFSTFLCGLATSFPLMLLFRLFAGISASFVTPQVWASIPIIVERKHIVQVMGYATAGLSASQMAGVPIGGYLASVSWQTPFYSIAIASLILLILIHIYLPKLEVGKAVKISVTEAYKDILANRKSISYLIAYFVFQTGSFTAITFISTWFTHDFNMSLTNISTAIIAVGAGNLFGSLFGSRIVKKFGLQQTFKAELITLVILYLILPFASNFWLAEILLIIIYINNGFIFPLFMTTLQGTVEKVRSTISSLSNAAMYLGEAIAGVVGGILFVKFTGFSGIAVFAAIMIALAWLLYAQAGAFRKRKSK
ncbi:MFS transporter [Streptococcus macacae]|uniref:Transporter, major facilitator family protein n=1 Tax=Streptococcus macacae NCTC 11558 TaxID=764298 RepID=G5JX17_9STRE|nr:MFS transporter [Streptococcus macacae]EHJ52607.1 transporter, major facilitator family protein [Streptococcus macacae NCTC 11558]SUN79496.1 putative multidrug resistance protein [Streptococcus macacae NCTC 11558]